MSQNITSTVILDLSAAFDTIDHDILLAILHAHFEIQGTALNWFKNYLWPWFFKVAVDGKYSSPRELRYGVPQGLCSGANLFTCYCSLIKDQIDNSITLNCICWWLLHAQQLQSRQQSTRTQIKTDLEEAFTQLKALNGYNSPEPKPWLKWKHTLWLLAAAQEDITRTSQCHCWPYCKK